MITSSGLDRENRGVATPLSEDQLAALAQEAQKHGNPLVRRKAFNRLLAALTPENAKAIREMLTDGGVKGDQWRDFNYAWGTIDGRAAVENAMTSPERDLASTMAGFASAHPQEARKYLETLPDDVKTDRTLMRQSLVSGMADRDVGLATDYVYDLARQGDERAADLLEVVSRKLLRNGGLDRAIEWSENLPDGDLKGAAMDRVADRYVDQNPEGAAAWAEQFVGESYARRVIEEVGDEWAERDPVAAVNWLESLPAGGGQNAGLNAAFIEWAARDPSAAGDRIAGMTRSSQRDFAINGYSAGISRRDPVAAISWANSIAQDSLRNSALTQAGQALFRRDSEAARSWVVSSGLPPEAQKAVLNPPRRRRR